MALASSDNNCFPNVITVASKKIISDNKFWVIDTFFGKTKTNILQNKKVAITMWKGKEGYQIKGIADYYSDGEIFEKAKKWILKSKPHKIVKGVIEVEITEIFSITPTYETAGKKIV